jgi:hypothetical protein
MNKLNFHKVGFFVILAMLMSFYSVEALSVTKPILDKEFLLRGESTRFHFMIDGTGSPNAMSCSYSYSGLEQLVITFDEQKAEVNAGESKVIFGTVSIPADAQLKTYDGMFSVQCEPLESEGGSKVVQSATLFFPTVSVVERVETPTTIPEKVPGTSYSLIAIMVVIIIIVIFAVYWFNKNKKIKPK